DEHAQSRRVDERRLREIDDELLLAVLDHLHEALLELRCGVEVDLPAEFDDVRVGVDFFVLDVEVHLTPRGLVVAAKPFSSRIRYAGSRSRTARRGSTASAGLARARRLCCRYLLLGRLLLALRRQRDRPLPRKVRLAGLA